MIVTAVTAVGLMVVVPQHLWLWGLVPFTYLGNSLAPLPYDGYIIALAQDYQLWLVVVIATAATLLIEAWNMELLAAVMARKGTRGFRAHPATQWAVRWFAKAPFWSMVASNCLPVVPHYPMRILATLARYPLWRYQLTVLIGRSLRYAWLGVLGIGFKVPVVWVVVGSFVLLALALRSARRMNRAEPSDVLAAAAESLGAGDADGTPTPARSS